MWHYVLVAALLVVLVKFLNWIWWEPKRMERLLRKQGLEGNAYRPFFGDAKEISAMYEEAHLTVLDPCDDFLPRVMPFVAKTVKKYGNRNVFVWIGPKPRVIISEPELIKTVLSDYRNYHKSFKATNKIIRLAIGGLALFEGDQWSKCRSKLNPGFNVNKLKRMIPTMRACCQETVNKLTNTLSEHSSGVVDVLELLNDLGGAVLVRALFNTPYSEDMRRCFHHLKDLTIMANAATNPFNFPGAGYLPTRTKRKALAMEKQVRNSIARIISERINYRRAGNTDGHDLLDLCLDELYDQNNTDASLHKRVIEDAIAQFKVLLFAGHATSNLLVWTLVSLATHQDWQSSAREEVFQVLGNTAEFDNDKLNQLKIVTMIFQEVLRFYPSGTEVSRIAEKDMELGGMHIPKGTLLQLQIILMHRNTEIWGQDAVDFKPQRFAEGAVKATNGRAAFMPFGWGPRICIGNNFSYMAAKVFLAQILRKYSFELAATYKHAPCAAFTIQPQFGAPLVFHQLD